MKAVIPQLEKTRTTIYVDNEVLETFRELTEDSGSGYPTMMNQALREYLARSHPAVDEPTLRRVLREELQRAGA